MDINGIVEVIKALSNRVDGMEQQLTDVVYKFIQPMLIEATESIKMKNSKGDVYLVTIDDDG
ncbi:MAG: hypothetical protein MJ139_04805, partial [Limosilactobacillus sp.]|nr:hypothetical protein [Limosilactobacillus sp.]